MTSSSTHYSLSVRFAEGFLPSVRELTKAEQERVWNAVQSLQVSPTSPGLNLKKLNGSGAIGAVWSARASKELRIVLRLSGSVAELVHAGHHDATYRRVPRISTPPPAVVPNAPAEITLPKKSQPSQERHSRPYSSEAPRRNSERVPMEEPPRALLWMWTSADLREVMNNRELAEVSDGQLRALVNATDANAEDVLLDGWPGDTNASLRADLLDLLLELAEISPDEWREAQLTVAESAAVERFAKEITEKGAAAALSVELNVEELRQLVSGPIEDWMIFLHPAQQEFVERDFNGPARVKGAAGTGKTTVALHRAAWLAKRPQQEAMFDAEPLPILFTTFIRTLPPVLEALYRRLPGHVEGLVEFVNVHELANRLCAETGVRGNINVGQTANQFAKAKRDVVRPGTPLHALRCTDAYLEDELWKVIVGRGIDDLDSYLTLERIGREVPFRQQVREQTWELYERCRELMNEKGLEHFDDQVRKARDYARTMSVPRYRSVVVDESQDLTQVGLELLSALVARRIPSGDGEPTRLSLGPNSLLVVGDAAQRIYPGGYTLGSAGVDVRGRSVTLGRNYRNTREIIEAAMACVGGYAVTDSDESEDAVSPSRRDDATSATDRTGVQPQLVIAPDRVAERSYVAEEIVRLTSSSSDLGVGDFGVFATTNDEVTAAITALKRASLGCINLKDFDGTTSDCIKVGTLDRAKGLEFKVVFLLGVSHGAWPFTARGVSSPAERADAETLAASKLFVGMTRARDALYVLCSEKPHRLIDAGRKHFESVRVPIA